MGNVGLHHLRAGYMQSCVVINTVVFSLKRNGSTVRSGRLYIINQNEDKKKNVDVQQAEFLKTLRGVFELIYKSRSILSRG